MNPDQNLGATAPQSTGGKKLGGEAPRTTYADIGTVEFLTWGHGSHSAESSPKPWVLSKVSILSTLAFLNGLCVFPQLNLKSNKNFAWKSRNQGSGSFCKVASSFNLYGPGISEVCSIYLLNTYVYFRNPKISPLIFKVTWCLSANCCTVPDTQCSCIPHIWIQYSDPSFVF